MSEPAPEPGPPAGQSRSLAAEFFDRRRLFLILGILAAEFVIFAVGVLTPLSSSAQQSLANETNSQFATVQSASPEQLVLFIFSHNLSIALIEMVPVLGAFLFVVSVYSTGLAAQVIVASEGLPKQFAGVLLVFPYSIVELSAYAIAVGAGTMLLVSWRRKRLRRELRVFVLDLVLVAVVLFVAATMEATTKLSLILGFALWLPTGLALAVIIVLSGRRWA